MRNLNEHGTAEAAASIPETVFSIPLDEFSFYGDFAEALSKKSEVAFVVHRGAPLPSWAQSALSALWKTTRNRRSSPVFTSRRSHSVVLTDLPGVS